MRIVLAVCSYFLLAILLCPVPVRSQATPNGKTLNDLYLWDSQFEKQLEQLEGEFPGEYSFDVTTLPRYKELRNRAASLVEQNRLTFLYDGPRIVQRVTGTTVLAGEVYGPTNVLNPCYDFCRYIGMVIVHLRQSTLDPFVKGQIYLHYIGVKTYTTVLGAAQTVPEFREVDLRTEFPAVGKALRDMENFSANGEERAEFIEPQMSPHALELAEWKLRAIRSEDQFLTDRRNLVEEIIADRQTQVNHDRSQQIGPTDICINTSSEDVNNCRDVTHEAGWVKACRYGPMSQYVPCPPTTWLPEQSEKLSVSRRQYDDMTSALHEKLTIAETDLAYSIQKKSVAWGVLGWRGHMDDFTRAWIRLNMSTCTDQNYRDDLRFGISRGARNELLLLRSELFCWSSRYEIPPGTKAEGRVVEPIWWRDYLDSSRSERHE